MHAATSLVEAPKQEPLAQHPALELATWTPNDGGRGIEVTLCVPGR